MYLSLVVVGSNRGYGGNFIERMQGFADNLFELAGQFKLEADLTVVEWNPPEDRPGIYEAIRWRNTIPVKIVTVPKFFHDSIPNPHGEAFFEYVAKNVGIRRAAGKFVLSTNPDNIYSPELIKYLARQELKETSFYRANRFDIRDGKIIAMNFAEGSIIDGAPQNNPNTACPDPNGQVDYPGLGLRPLLHFNASGDFILMSRDKWFEIHGHPEVPYSLTVDGQTVYLAAQAGLEQTILPWPIYHQDHSRTSKFCPAWADHKPFGARNQTWGFENIDFDERRIQPTA